jgi:phospholipase C
MDNSDHPGSRSTIGPDWAASIVNAVGHSKYWNSTVNFVTWDDWGGWYDHVLPPRPMTWAMASASRCF